MKIYKILKNGYFGGAEIIPDSKKGIPLYRTRTAPPEIPEGKYAKWVGSKWKIIETPPIEITEPIFIKTESIVTTVDSDGNIIEHIIDSDGLLIDSNMDSNQL